MDFWSEQNKFDASQFHRTEEFWRKIEYLLFLMQKKNLLKYLYILSQIREKIL